MDALGNDSRKAVDEAAVGGAAPPIPRLEGSVPENEAHDQRDATVVTGIGRFPPELLIQIFGWCLEDRPWRDPHSSRLTLGWINITYVCQSWRSLAIECTHLWTHVSLAMGDAWVEEILRRSGQKDLHVDDFPQSGSLSQMPVGIIQKHAHRMRSIDIKPQVQPDLEDIIKAFALPMPRLEYLRLRDTPARYDLPQTLNAPNLCHLDLDGPAHRFAWTAAALRNILTLCLVSKGAEMFCPSVDEVLGALAGMPLLESLTLHYALPRSPPGGAASTSHDAVVLEALKHCSIHGAEYDVASLLTALRLPPDVQLDLNLVMDADITQLNAFAPLIPLLTTYIHPALHLIALRTPMGPYNHPKLEFLVYRTDDTQGPDVKLTFTIIDQRPHILLRFLSQTLPIANLRRLSIISLDPGAMVWTTILRRAVSLEEVTAHSRAGLTFCWAIANFDSAEVATGTTRRTTRFTKLVLRKVKFRVEPACGEAEELRAWLVRRKEAGRPLLTLNVTPGSFGKKDVEGWQPVPREMPEFAHDWD
ncbi:hypothetical protein FA95DRAFT_1613701 [Auriscalpium vulgare]|uniref:Uncharacterized protein n=1 Tax=Auriscalpium vulgare TaxID=40419 RepID=A0ACB8R1K3_9AGAM|nr:hypothetical protein FA95DRAFT_1613701 [Auriscalpium vulgare]